MDDVNTATTGANKRLSMAASGRTTRQRQQSQSQLLDGSDIILGGLPLHQSSTTTTITTGSSGLLLPPPPRSGQKPLQLLPKNVLLKQFNVRDKTDASGKRRLFQVNVPPKLMMLLGLVFLAVPLLLFLYKEVHIHDIDEHHVHFKPEKFLNVDTEDVFSQLRKYNTTTTSTTQEEDAKAKHGKDHYQKGSSSFDELDQKLEDTTTTGDTQSINAMNNGTLSASGGSSVGTSKQSESSVEQRRRQQRFLRRDLIS